jgi:predicted nucleotidyltransferase
MTGSQSEKQTMGKASEVYNQHKAAIREIASRYPVANIRVFGSVVHGDDRESSDIDLLVDALPEATLFDLGGLQDELRELLGVNVDLLTPGDLPLCFRESVISEARPV